MIWGNIITIILGSIVIPVFLIQNNYSAAGWALIAIIWCFMEAM